MRIQGRTPSAQRVQLVLARTTLLLTSGIGPTDAKTSTATVPFAPAHRPGPALEGLMLERTDDLRREAVHAMTEPAKRRRPPTVHPARAASEGNADLARNLVSES